MTTVRETRRADELKPGDWLAAMQLDGDNDLPSEVLGAHPYVDEEGPAILLVFRASDGVPRSSDSDAATKFELATEVELNAAREQADRAQKIADLRQAVDFLAERPWLPLPEVHVHVHLQDDAVGNYRTVRELAEREGVTLNTSLNDRTEFKLRTGALYYSAIAWHKDGRPSEPEPEPVTHVVLRRADHTACGVPVTRLGSDDFVTSWSEISTCKACADEAPF